MMKIVYQDYNNIFRMLGNIRYKDISIFPIKYCTCFEKVTFYLLNPKAVFILSLVIKVAVILLFLVFFSLKLQNLIWTCATN